MTCTETREYLFAFLDNELDAPLSIELQRHLEHCHDCSREAETERTIHHRLASTLENQAVTPDFDKHTIVRTLIRSSTERDHLKKRFGYMAIAACIVVGLGAGLAMWLTANGSVGRVAVSPFVQLLTTDLQKFLDKEQPLQIASADPQAVTAWLREETGVPIVVPSPSSSDIKLLGARRCTIAGQSAAFAVYEIGTIPVSLVAFAGEQINLKGMERVQHGKRPHWVGRCGKYTVVACRRGKLLYSAVGTVPEDKLLYLIPGATNESN